MPVLPRPQPRSMHAGVCLGLGDRWGVGVGEDFLGEHEAAGPDDGPVGEVVVGFVAGLDGGVIEEGVGVDGCEEVDGAGGGGDVQCGGCGWGSGW